MDYMKTNIGKLTVAAVRKAYRELGWQPRFGGWIKSEKGVIYACPITAFIRHKVEPDKFPAKLSMVEIAGFLGVTMRMLDSLTDGMDGHERSEDTLTSAYNLGIMIREAILADKIKISV